VYLESFLCAHTDVCGTGRDVCEGARGEMRWCCAVVRQVPEVSPVIRIRPIDASWSVGRYNSSMR